MLESNEATSLQSLIGMTRKLRGRSNFAWFRTKLVLSRRALRGKVSFFVGDLDFYSLLTLLYCAAAFAKAPNMSRKNKMSEKKL